MEYRFLLIWILYLPQVTSSTKQDCLNKRQALSSLRQIQKLLSDQEAYYLQSLRTMKKKISLLQNTITRRVSKHNETCPKLEVPDNGRKMGSISAVGHEVHFLCEKGFELVGSETRVCQESHKWSGQQPFCRNINECAKSPCLNGGTCVDDVNRFACMCARGWSGTYCQNSVYSYWTSQTNSSFSRQPHCASMQGSTQCTCDEGFQIAGRDNSLCQDIDECELYYSGRLPRLCAHACVNTPGSYRCTCPPGYTLRGDHRNCKDVDECASRQHNCSRDELCVNTFGGFQCMQPDCPKPLQNISYVKTSLLRCERNPCPVDNKACAQAASSISFSYLSLVSNLTVPRVLFRVSATRLHGDSLRFVLLGGRGRSPFIVQRSDRLTGELVLVSPVLGPAVLEAELEMTELEKKTVLGRFISKVTVFISQYDF